MPPLYDDEPHQEHPKSLRKERDQQVTSISTSPLAMKTGDSNSKTPSTKKKRKRLPKSERKRRKRLREAAAKEAELASSNDSGNDKKSDVNPDVADLRAQVIENGHIIEKMTQEDTTTKSSCSPPKESKEREERMISDDSSSTKVTSESTNKNSTNDISTSSSNMRMVEFVYPKNHKSAQDKKSQMNGTGISYVHGKLKRLSETKSCTKEQNEDHNQSKITKEMEDEDINDILYPERKKKKKNLKKNEDKAESQTDSYQHEKEQKKVRAKIKQTVPAEQELSKDEDLSSKQLTTSVDKTPSKVNPGHKNNDDNKLKRSIEKPNSMKNKENGKKSSAKIEGIPNPPTPERQLSGTTVEDAIKDKVGRRPRSNSTDGELNLPQRGLCDEHMVLESHKWDVDKLYSKNGGKPVSPRGFQNLGNTCFLNATLQCLGHLPTFCQCLATMPLMNQKGDKKKKMSNGQKITSFLRVLLREMHGLNGSSSKSGPITPREIVRSISLLGGTERGYKFRPGRQEDAHEFLVHLMNIIHDGELKAAGIDQKKSGWRDSLPIPRLDETTFVHRMFGGYLRSQVKCTRCNYSSNTYDPFLDLSLEVSGKKAGSVTSAFAAFTRKETLDSSNKWKCSGCKKRVCATKQLTCFRPPLTLCIQLKRFSFGGGMGGFMHHKGGWGYGHFAGKGMGMMQGGSKIQKPVDFPATLKLPLSDGRRCDYELTGIVIHVGGSATSGHYTAYVRRPISQTKHNWYHMDDSFCEPVSEKSVLKQKNAYLLFYCRKEVKLEIPSPPPIPFKNAEEAQRVGEARANARAKARANSINSLEGKSTNQDLVSNEHEKKSNIEEETNETRNAGNDSSIENASENLKNSDVIHSHSIKEGTKRKSLKKGNEKKIITTNLDQRGAIQVVMKSSKNKRKWVPSIASGFDQASRSHDLLGNKNVSGWEDDDSKAETKGVELFRKKLRNETKQKDKAKKRKMYPDKWDSILDEGKVKKLKSKETVEYEAISPKNNKFQRIYSQKRNDHSPGKMFSQKKRRKQK